MREQPAATERCDGCAKLIGQSWGGAPPVLKREAEAMLGSLPPTAAERTKRGRRG